MAKRQRHDVEHCFDLSRLKAGDEFSGCWTCWHQVESDTHEIKRGVPRRCPRCHRAGMRVFTVTKEDLSAAKAQ